MLKMENLSKREIEVISDLEFQKKYFFRKADIRHHFNKSTQLIKTIYHLRRKKRIVRLSRDKYYLIPIRARTGKWTENPFIVADEIFNGEGYFVGGWSSAYYWSLTNQIPMQTDIWTTKRQGKVTVLGIRFHFHRTTEKRINESTIQSVEGHSFRIQSKEESKKWMKSKR